jgi:hypothetical protein
VTDLVHQAAGAIKTKIVKFAIIVDKIEQKPTAGKCQNEIP